MSMNCLIKKFYQEIRREILATSSQWGFEIVFQWELSGQKIHKFLRKTTDLYDGMTTWNCSIFELITLTVFCDSALLCSCGWVPQWYVSPRSWNIATAHKACKQKEWACMFVHMYISYTYICIYIYGYPYIYIFIYKRVPLSEGETDAVI